MVRKSAMREQIACLAMAGQPLPEESSVWPPSAVRKLHLSRSAVTADGVAHLAALPSLAFLDVRGTGVPRVRGLCPATPLPPHQDRTLSVHRCFRTCADP